MKISRLIKHSIVLYLGIGILFSFYALYVTYAGSDRSWVCPSSNDRQRPVTIGGDIAYVAKACAKVAPSPQDAAKIVGTFTLLWPVIVWEKARSF